ncbi:hypothetical protein EV356DRAFT_504561 [Viridothelium virens]|uniref:Uncharacterized protein n=1 Tax=Viridothelium virens TaxID=1048519 RepID=A0A6A6H5H3_VIRVR|nr:hypothetical protein EV356DRAFT_504561 [Viridothelium virens]
MVAGTKIGERYFACEGPGTAMFDDVTPDPCNRVDSLLNALGARARDRVPSQWHMQQGYFERHRKVRTW